MLNRDAARVARQSFNRMLGELQRRELIRVEGSGRSIELLDRMALRRLAVGRCHKRD
jgi:Crp-like helix-turn-helix domain